MQTGKEELNDPRTNSKSLHNKNKNFEEWVKNK